MKRVVYLSHIINERTPLYAGEKGLRISRIKSLSRGDSCNKSSFSLSAHTGTHMDAPRHFLDKGKAISGLLPQELFFKKVFLAVIRDAGPGRIITEKDLAGIRDCELLLLKTGFEKHRNKTVYWKNSPALDPGLADYIKKACPRIRAVGVDFISITSLKNRELGRQAHKAFLSSGILLLEDMKLRSLKIAPDMVITAPLLIDKAEASPTTVLALHGRI